MAKRLGRNSVHVRVSAHTVDGRIAAVAAPHHGNVTTRELLEAGIDKDGIAHRLKMGRLFREHHGVYSVGRPARTPIERASAAVLAGGPGAALSHSSAMALWGYWNRWDQPFEIVVPADRRPRGITAHRPSTLRWRDLTTQLGVRVTSPARTIFDMTSRLNDRTLARTVNNALHSKWMNESELAELIGRLGHLPAARRLAPLIGLDGTPPRSGWEDEFPVFCAESDLPVPIMGARVCGYIVDALFPAEKVIVELDSWEYHKDPVAFETDRERDVVTLAHGFVTVRITWERVHTRWDVEAARLRTILEARRALTRAGRAARPR
jgi:predicted transcriptional regulator of viral defense system